MLQETLKAKLIHTDDRREMERIGEEIMNAMPSRYDARTMGLMKAAVAKSMPDLLGDEADRYLKRTVYGYWVYGVTTKEWFYYDFENKTDEEKCEYIGFMDRFSYLRHLNNLELGQKVLDDKYTAYQLMKRFYKREIIRIADEKDYEVFADFVSRHTVFVKKPLNANIGIGIRKITVRPDTDLKALFEELLKEGQLHAKSQPWGNSSDIILEELIRQDEHLAQLHAESVNVVRVNTFRACGKTLCWYPWLKISQGGKFLTSASEGSMGCSVHSETGVVRGPGVTEFGALYHVHPDTGIRLEGFQIPRWDECRRLAEEVSDLFPDIRFIGWDFALTPDGWCVVEGNSKAEFVEQLTEGRGTKRELEGTIGWKPDREFWWE